MQDDHLVALESVLGRKGLSREDVAIFNLNANAWADSQKIIEYFKPDTILILGKSALPQGMKAPAFNAVNKKGSKALLHTYSFDEMMMNAGNKKAFWEQVKNL